MTDRHTERLGTVPVGRLLRELSLPAILGMLVHATYNVVDGIFIGRGVGSDALAGVTVAFPVQMMSFAIVVLVATGGSALFSIYLGARREEDALRCLGNSYLSIVVLCLSFAAVVLLFRDEILRAFGGGPTILSYASTYITIILPFGVFMGFQVLGENFTRAEGNARKAMESITLSSIVNVSLDWLFIFPLGWGVAGAAWATVIAQLVGSAYLANYVFRHSRRLRISLSHLRPDFGVLRRIYAIGFSAFSRQVTFSVQSLFLNNSVVAYGGESALAILGILMRIFMFIVLPVFGILQGMRPIMSYNYGACLYNRARQSLKYGILGATATLTVGFLLVQLLPLTIMGIFTTDPVLIEQGARVLRITTIVLPIISVQIVGAASFQAIGKPGYALVFSVVRQVLLFIPLLLVLPLFLGLDGIWLTYPVSDVLAMVATGIFIKRVWGRLPHTDGAPGEEGL